MRQEFSRILICCLLLAGCTNNGTSTASRAEEKTSETIIIYDNAHIPANMGISKMGYDQVDGYRYANVLVEWQQDSDEEEPISLSVIFAHDSSGKWGAGRYAAVEEHAGNAGNSIDPTMLSVSGRNSWIGSQWKKSHYIARFPVMGPYMKVFPFNQHNKEREFSIVLYLTK